MGAGYLEESFSYFTKVSIKYDKVKADVKELKPISNSKKKKKNKKN